MIKRYRIEKDVIGEKKIPIDAYYGIHTLRSKENFSITKRMIHKQMIRSLAIIKKSAALANMDANLISLEVAKAIAFACDEVINGRLHSQFITDAIQGGAGTSINMNINEVIANRANEIMGGKRGEYNFVHPLDHVNFGQSANDVIPTAGKITTIVLAKKLLIELKKLHKAFLDKAKDHKGILKMGRTHLQDAVPIGVEQEFDAIATSIERDIKRINSSLEDLMTINMGATAIGTGLNADPVYIQRILFRINEFTKLNFKHPENMIDVTRNLDAFLHVSSSLKVFAVNLSKTANDLRLMASGPKTGFNEIILPRVQAGSTTTPDKVNPVIPEVVNQVCFQVIGNDMTITKAVEAGQLELNVFSPVLLANLFDSIDYLRRAASTLREKAVEGLTVNVEKCIEHVEKSAWMLTVLSPHIGYEQCVEIAKESYQTNTPIRDIVFARGLLSEQELKKIFDYHKVTKPGIIDNQYLKLKKK